MSRETRRCLAIKARAGSMILRKGLSVECVYLIRTGFNSRGGPTPAANLRIETL